MNIIANNVVSKLFVAFVATAMLFTLATPAKAATVEELMAEIAALQAQISGLGGSSSASTAGKCTFTGPLTVGSQGAEVKCLQDYLTSTGHFSNPTGSTGYFGPVTAAAVAAWQTANGVTPAAGYFGPLSQAKYNAMMASAPTTGGEDPSEDPEEDPSEDPEEEESGELSGEASLDTFEVADGDEADDVEEGSEDVEVAEFTVEFSDGDAMITRLDIALVGTGNTEADPWDVFDEISLWVDGEEVDRMDASEEDEYLDEDDGSLRFSGLDIVGMEDEEVKIVVAASITSSVDDAGDSSLADWDVFAGSLRYVDADDVTTTDDATGDLDDAWGGAAAEFTIDTTGAGDDLDLETSTDDPESKTISLDEDDNVEDSIFAFELSAEDSDGDVDLNEVQVYVFTSTTSLDEVVNDFRLEIGDDSYDAESYTGTGPGALITFDIDGDTTVPADDVLTAVLYADFENMDEAGNEGTTIIASTTPSYIDAEGADDITVDGSEVEGESHSLRTEGLEVTLVSDDASKSFAADDAGERDKGEFEIVFKVKALGDAIYLDRTVTRDDTTAGGSAGDGFMWATTTDSTTGTTSIAATVAAEDTDTNDTATKYYIGEDEEREFTVTVTLEAGIDGAAGVKLTAINWTTDSADATPDNFHTTGLEDFLTNTLTLIVE